jgi:hypothetical protein
MVCVHFLAGSFSKAAGPAARPAEFGLEKTDRQRSSAPLAPEDQAIFCRRRHQAT